MNNSNILYFMIVIASLMLVDLTTTVKSGEASEEDLVDDTCLGCICDAISNCNVTTTCNSKACGLFRITWIYWADMGKMTVNGESPDSPTAFVNCVSDPYCATRSVQKYMRTYKQDCNGDGKIDCYDFASIHVLGGRGCPARIWGHYDRTVKQCLKAYSYDIDTDYLEDQTTLIMQNDDFKSDEITTEEVPQTTEIGQEATTEMEQVFQTEDFHEVFNQATEDSNQHTEDFNKNKEKSSLKALTKLPPLALLGYLRPKVNTTTASPIKSKLDNDEKGFSSKTILDTENASLVPEVDIASRFSDESISSVVLEGPNGSDNSQLKNPPVEISQVLFSKLDQMEKNNDDYRNRELRLQEKFLEAFINQNRIDEERNKIFNEMANNKGSDGNNGITQLERRALRRRQDRLFNKIEQMEESENEHMEKNLKFQEAFLEAFMKKTSTENERNEFLKQIAKNNKQSDIAPNYFLL
ncbi:uncharacterized protein LOC129919234 [Episyrphus balteatus]|uniref:uncharacterized protein LOC129919234 n=1 Tax=Episyrphus balteatus TaxID=286459 RepID=UPI0024857C1E|nr:uncharacterized protein LOC129919234 [Episyrphus balteatus]